MLQYNDQLEDYLLSNVNGYSIDLPIKDGSILVIPVLI